MSATIDSSSLEKAVRVINEWHPNTPLILVFARQKPGPSGSVSGNVEAVRATYDALFSLEQIGIPDDARMYYLHFCHGSGAKDYPFAIKKPTDNYGKTHQRIIKDTFANPDGFLVRVAEGSYKLKSDAPARMLKYLGFSGPVDLKPLLLLHYWRPSAELSTIGDMWKKFCATFQVDKPPFDKVFTCTGLGEAIPFAKHGDEVDMRRLCLPNDYGTGACDAAFWNRFRSILDDKLKEIRWQGRLGPLVAGITSSLMHDQSVFVLGAPGTGKTSLVTSAILPALRLAYGTENELRFSEFTLTPSTTSADLFGFQGLDGKWVQGPFVRDVMLPYSPDSIDDTGASPDDRSMPGSAEERASPHLVFFDEANRVDIEALLSPIQTALDRLQARKPGGVVKLGSDQYTLPGRIWRVFAGNSPATDLGRKEQSRPFKRRLSVVMPPDPMEELIGNTSRFRSACTELLERATHAASVEISEPALGLLGEFSSNSDRLDDLRLLLAVVKDLPQVAVTVGLLESILQRAASLKSLRQDSPLDASLVQSLLGLLSGDSATVSRVADVAEERGFTQLSAGIRRTILSVQGADGSFDIDSLL